MGYDPVNCIMEDREGNIWVGAKDGLHQLRRQAFSTYTKKNGLTHNNVMSVVEDSDHSALDDLVFQRRDSQRPLLPVGLRYADSLRGLRPICSAVDPAMQIFQSILLPGLILFPCHPSTPGAALRFNP